MIRLPWPPTVNHYYTVARGRKILSKRGREYKKWCAAELMLQKPLRSRQGDVRVCINAYPPDKRRRDLDNLIKPVLDVLTECGLIEDDSLVVDLRIQRFNSVKGGKVEIMVD